MKYDFIDSVVFKLVYKGKRTLSEICKSENIRLFSFSDGAKLIKHLGLENEMVDNVAFTFGRIIFFDDTEPIKWQKHAVAHELGHILLHTGKMNKSCEELEREANAFAARLLFYINI